MEWRADAEAEAQARQKAEADDELYDLYYGNMQNGGETVGVSEARLQAEAEAKRLTQVENGGVADTFFWD